MHSSEADESRSAGWGLDELQVLAALGFGPDSALMNGPKLFVDGPFLAALHQELETELGHEEARRTLFHIGVIHGLRDAERIGSASPVSDGVPGVIECPPVVMRFAPADPGSEGTLSMSGSWPDGFEAEARLSKLGPANGPGCALSAGYTSGWLSGTLDRNVRVEELECRAAGGTCCQFAVHEEDGGGASPNLPIASLRAVAQAPSSASTTIPMLPPTDPEDPAVHIWGPVMVMPFAGPEAAMQTVELLGLDEATHSVRVVVVDLDGQLIDPGFGAAALERIAEEIQRWGAEVVLTGISADSEEVIAELQASLMLARKDLAEAIAYAFQVADAQRHLI